MSDIVILSSRSVVPANKWRIQLVNETLREELSCAGWSALTAQQKRLSILAAASPGKFKSSEVRIF